LLVIRLPVASVLSVWIRMPLPVLPEITLPNLPHRSRSSYWTTRATEIPCPLGTAAVPEGATPKYPDITATRFEHDRRTR
jgi:hypothetical protein